VPGDGRHIAFSGTSDHNSHGCLGIAASANNIYPDNCRWPGDILFDALVYGKHVYLMMMKIHMRQPEYI
jgi:hypothetical protein